MTNMDTIYIEDEIKDHPRTAAILAKFSGRLISCRSYKEIFNRRGQSFKLQKQNPSLILAKKHDSFVLSAPEGFGIGGRHNYYFSLLLNCPFDCRYCFLQGMYDSAHYVLFVNYEDYFARIAEMAERQPGSYFFSGYDADSLALDAVTHSVAPMLDFFASQSQAFLELRTKSLAIGALLRRPANPQTIVAFSLTPARVSAQFEHRTPPLAQRLKAMAKLSQAGWLLGLRFDPLIYAPDFEALYAELMDQVLAHINASSIHSVSIGPLRFPKDMHKKLVKLYPLDPLVNHPLVARGEQMSYSAAWEEAMQSFVLGLCQKHNLADLVFRCTPEAKKGNFYDGSNQ